MLGIAYLALYSRGLWQLNETHLFVNLNSMSRALNFVCKLLGQRSLHIWIYPIRHDCTSTHLLTAARFLYSLILLGLTQDIPHQPSQRQTLGLTPHCPLGPFPWQRLPHLLPGSSLLVSLKHVGAAKIEELIDNKLILFYNYYTVLMPVIWTIALEPYSRNEATWMGTQYGNVHRSSAFT